jgi:hypothetical protein
MILDFYIPSVDIASQQFDTEKDLKVNWETLSVEDKFVLVDQWTEEEFWKMSMADKWTYALDGSDIIREYCDR